VRDGERSALTLEHLFAADDGDLTSAWEHNVAGYVVKSGDGARFRAALSAFTDYWSRVEMPG
jgi:hypothetical protein